MPPTPASSPRLQLQSRIPGSFCIRPQKRNHQGKRHSARVNLRYRIKSTRVGDCCAQGRQQAPGFETFAPKGGNKHQGSRLLHLRWATSTRVRDFCSQGWQQAPGFETFAPQVGNKHQGSRLLCPRAAISTRVRDFCAQGAAISTRVRDFCA